MTTVAHDEPVEEHLSEWATKALIVYEMNVLASGTSSAATMRSGFAFRRFF